MIAYKLVAAYSELLSVAACSVPASNHLQTSCAVLCICLYATSAAAKYIRSYTQGTYEYWTRYVTNCWPCNQADQTYMHIARKPA